MRAGEMHCSILESEKTCEEVLAWALPRCFPEDNESTKESTGLRIAVITIAAGLLLVSSCDYASAQGKSPIERIEAISMKSKCASIDWKERGRVPKAYIDGMALMFAKAVCQPSRSDVRVVSAARGTPATDADRTDALTWYDSVFRELGMSNSTDGLDTLRHAYVLLIGVGVRETSGKYCAGRDRSAHFDSADSAEAGLFQTSWGAHRSNHTLSGLFDRYSSDEKGCLLDVFRQGVFCSAWDAKTWGEGKGVDWQKLTKSCPGFATEYAAVLIRTSGGEKGEFGSLRTRKAEVRPACDAMLHDIQEFAQSNPQICASIEQVK